MTKTIHILLKQIRSSWPPFSDKFAFTFVFAFIHTSHETYFFPLDLFKTMLSGAPVLQNNKRFAPCICHNQIRMWVKPHFVFEKILNFFAPPIFCQICIDFRVWFYDFIVIAKKIVLHSCVLQTKNSFSSRIFHDQIRIWLKQYIFC